jgi:sigma-E factor negative regulatory protein RseC
MIEEVATVIECSEQQALLEAQRQSSCGSCAAKAGCGTAVFANTLGKKSSRITVANTLNLQVGDKVVVGLQENALLLGSFMIYLLPLIALIVFAVLGKWLTGQFFNSNNEILVIGFAIVGFVLAIRIVKKFSARVKNDSSFQPVLLRKLIS